MPIKPQAMVSEIESLREALEAAQAAAEVDKEQQEWLHTAKAKLQQKVGASDACKTP